MKLRQIIRDYFTFTKNERIGLSVLLMLIVLVLLANQFIYYFETPAKADRVKFQRLLDEQTLQEKKEPAPFSGKLFQFNPNTIDPVKLDSLLLPSAVKRNLLSYRSKGGYFYTARDLRKIYGMNDSVFDTIEGYIQIEARQWENTVTKREQPKYEKVTGSREIISEVKEVNEIIEINSAAAADLMKLNGIGPVLSERIVKYRNWLGGFFSLDQLHEVYGLKAETIENILPYLNLDVALVKQINVNFAETEQLSKHPYIRWETANAIVRFRSESGFIDDLGDLQIKKVLNESDYQRISPYLKTKY